MDIDYTNLVDIKCLNGIIVVCKICGDKVHVESTISAHEWGFMVEGTCKHVFPVIIS